MKKHIAGKNFSEYRRESAFPEYNAREIIYTEIFSECRRKSAFPKNSSGKIISTDIGR